MGVTLSLREEFARNTFCHSAYGTLIFSQQLRMSFIVALT
jgi:hypothetical protein